MLGKLYTMNAIVPNAWLHLLAFLESHQKAGIIDLRPLGQEGDDPQWKRNALDAYFRFYAKEHHYAFIGLLTGPIHLPVDADDRSHAAVKRHIGIARLVSRLKHGEDLVCFCSSSKYEGSIRQAVAMLVREHLPEVEHQELEIMGVAGMNPFRFYALSEPERAALRYQERRCIEVLHACKPLAGKLTTVAGVYTPLDDAEEQVLQMFHEFAQAHEGEAYRGAFDLLCQQAGLLHSEVGLLEGRVEMLFYEREPAQAKVRVMATIKRLLSREAHQE